MKFQIKPWHILGLAVLALAATYQFVMQPAIAEMKELSDLRAGVKAPDIPEVTVLSLLDIQGTKASAFYVKSTNMVCYLTPNESVLNGALTCSVAQSDVHKRVLEINRAAKL